MKQALGWLPRSGLVLLFVIIIKMVTALPLTKWVYLFQGGKKQALTPGADNGHKRDPADGSLLDKTCSVKVSDTDCKAEQVKPVTEATILGRRQFRHKVYLFSMQVHRSFLLKYKNLCPIMEKGTQKISFEIEILSIYPIADRFLIW